MVDNKLHGVLVGVVEVFSAFQTLPPFANGAHKGSIQRPTEMIQLTELMHHSQDV
jgi:hypothetical protein